MGWLFLEIKINLFHRMNIVVVGNEKSFEECRTKFGGGHQYQYFDEFPFPNSPKAADIIFDFHADWTREQLNFYANVKSAPIFLNTVFTTLSNLLPKKSPETKMLGFCGLPTFFNRSIVEITHSQSNSEILKPLMNELKSDYRIVKDEVGMVTPRIVCMIINEAYEALQQGVASREDIDLSMKLGTNYPYGPFEWGERIGLDNVRRLLRALEKSSGESSRYRCNF
jgi:3-hydroxybutyryl-CoA dehydrogenase